MSPAARSTILVADDDPDLRDILRSILEPAGFRVIEAADGAAALEAVRSAHPDLLVLDFNMPRMTGPEVCAVLRADMLLRHLPVVMLTGRSDLHDKVHGIEAGADDYLVKPFEPKELLARVKMVLRRTGQDLDANPLTKLPGNVSIERDIEGRLARREPMAVCYADLDRFKAFNDHYGFQRGDRAIQHTAAILLEAVRSLGTPTDFIGHIGGDDFVFVTTPDRVDAMCRKIVEQFDATAPALYDEADRVRGFVSTTDRKGQPVQAGILTISIAAVTTEDLELTHLGQIAALGAELKTYAKRVDKSLYVKDRRRELP